MERIQYSEDILAEENIDSNINMLWGRAIPILQHRKELYDRYTRKNDNQEVRVPLEYYISTIASGYFGGKEPQYKIKQLNDTQKGIVKDLFDKKYNDSNDADKFQTLINYIASYNDNPSFFYECVKDYINTGACYGLLYENEDNEIVYAYTSSLNNVAIWDYKIPSNKIGLLRYWTENSERGIKVHLEIITKDYKKEFIDNNVVKEIKNSAKDNFKSKESQTVLWDDLPVFAVENIDGLSQYSLVTTLIDKYEQVIKNNVHTFQYNDDAKLQVTGFTPDNPLMIESKDENGNTVLDTNNQPVMIKNPNRIKEDEMILNSKVFYTPDQSGNISWVTKDINDSASENHKKTLLDLALMISGVPNVTDQGFTNADNSSALEKKFFPLEQCLQTADHDFRKELLRMWELIVNRINIEKKTNFDFRDIQVILTRNLPQNNTEIISNWMKLRGLLSDKTVIEHLPYDLDAESEITKLEDQNEENIEENLKNMQKMGQDVGSQDNSQEYKTETKGNDNASQEDADLTKKQNVKQNSSVKRG